MNDIRFIPLILNSNDMATISGPIYPGGSPVNVLSGGGGKWTDNWVIGACGGSMDSTNVQTWDSGTKGNGGAYIFMDAVKT